MHENVIYEEWQIEELTTNYTLHCNILLGRNGFVTYIADILDLYGDDEEEQV